MIRKKSELPVGSVIKLVSGDILCVKFQDTGDAGNDFRYVATGAVCNYAVHRCEWNLVSAPGARLTEDGYFSDPRVQELAVLLARAQDEVFRLREQIEQAGGATT